MPAGLAHTENGIQSWPFYIQSIKNNQMIGISSTVAGSMAVSNVCCKIRRSAARSEAVNFSPEGL